MAKKVHVNYDLVIKTKKKLKVYEKKQRCRYSKMNRSWQLYQKKKDLSIKRESRKQQNPDRFLKKWF